MKRALVLFAGLCLSGVIFSGCLSKDAQPVEPPKDEVPLDTVKKMETGFGTIIGANGKPAAGAEVRIIPVAYVPKSGLLKTTATIFKTETDAEGRYSLSNVSAGDYNITSSKNGQVSFQDSVGIEGAASIVKPDTLAQPGSIIGTIAMQVNHNPATVTLQLLGTTVFVNTDDEGRFEIGGLAEGAYSILFETTLPEYTKLYSGFTVSAGRATEIKEPFRLIYTGIPIVSGIHASYDTLNGATRVAWQQVKKNDLLGYAILRNPISSQTISTIPLNKSRITDTVYLDTLYPKNDISLNVQGWEYRVVAQTKNGKYGEWFESAGISAPSPAHVRTFIDLNASWKVAGIVSINDTLRISAKFYNTTRKIKTLSWILNSDSIPVRKRSIDVASGVDTLVYLAPSKPQDDRVICRIVDDAGTVWEEGIIINTILDPPTAIASGSQEGFPNTSLKLNGKGSDQLGNIRKMEWDIGGTGLFVPASHEDTLITLPNKVVKGFPCILRVTDDDGLIDLDTLNVKIFSWFRMSERPIPPPEWEAYGAKHPYLAELNGKIYVLGGRKGVNAGALTVFDPATDQWTTKASTDSVGPLYVLDQKLYLPMRNGLKLYDPNTDQWNTKAPPPVSTLSGSRFTATTLNGKLYVVSGVNLATGEIGVTQEYNPTSDSWKTFDPAPWFSGGAAHPRVEPIWNGLPTDLMTIKNVIVSQYLNNSYTVFDPSVGTWTSFMSSNGDWFRSVPIGVIGDQLYTWQYHYLQTFRLPGALNYDWAWPLTDTDLGYSMAFHILDNEIYSVNREEDLDSIGIGTRPVKFYTSNYQPRQYPFIGNRFQSVAVDKKIYIFAYFDKAPEGSKDRSAFYEYTP